jgi:hypothetical protein
MFAHGTEEFFSPSAASGSVRLVLRWSRFGGEFCPRTDGRKVLRSLLTPSSVWIEVCSRRCSWLRRMTIFAPWRFSTWCANPLHSEPCEALRSKIDTDRLGSVPIVWMYEREGGPRRVAAIPSSGSVATSLRVPLKPCPGSTSVGSVVARDVTGRSPAEAVR